MWNLTWDDVEQFHRAVTADPPTMPPDRVLHRPRPPATPAEAGPARPRAAPIDVDVLEQNPMALLLDFLVRPDLARAWQRAVLSAVGRHGLHRRAVRRSTPTGSVRSARRRAACRLGRRRRLRRTRSWRHGARALTPEQLPARALFLDARRCRTPSGGPRWRCSTTHPRRVQRTRAPRPVGRLAALVEPAPVPRRRPSSERAGSSAGSSQHELVGLGRPLAAPSTARRGPSPAPTGDARVTAPSTGVTATLTDDQLEELDLLVDADAARLARQSLERGAPPFVAGYEVDGDPARGRVARACGSPCSVGRRSRTPSGWDGPDGRSEWTLDELLDARWTVHRMTHGSRVSKDLLRPLRSASTPRHGARVEDLARQVPAAHRCDELRESKGLQPRAVRRTSGTPGPGPSDSATTTGASCIDPRPAPRPSCWSTCSPTTRPTAGCCATSSTSTTPPARSRWSTSAASATCSPTCRHAPPTADADAAQLLYAHRADKEFAQLGVDGSLLPLLRASCRPTTSSNRCSPSSLRARPTP
ncbi:MAG: hypothetical protein V9E94_14120 [Microthrixaceae bacterium]